MKGKGLAQPASAGLRANGPVTRARLRAGLAQRAGSGRIGLGQQRPARKRRGKRVIMDMPGKLCRGDAEIGRDIGGGGAAEAVAAAREAFVMLLLVMVRRLSAVVGVLLRAGFGVSGAHM